MPTKRITWLTPNGTKTAHALALGDGILPSSKEYKALCGCTLKRYTNRAMRDGDQYCRICEKLL